MGKNLGRNLTTVTTTRFDSVCVLNEGNINYNLWNLETDLALPRPKTKFLKRSFKYFGAMLRNSLPQEAKTAQTLL